jgi:hypothetical protein
MKIGKTEVSCHSRPCVARERSTQLQQPSEHRPKFCSPSPVNISIYKLKKNHKQDLKQDINNPSPNPPKKSSLRSVTLKSKHCENEHGLYLTCNNLLFLRLMIKGQVKICVIAHSCFVLNRYKIYKKHIGVLMGCLFVLNTLNIWQSREYILYCTYR